VADRIRWFTEDVEPEARNQVERTASMPFVAGVAVMPDVHFGRGSTVGTVVATRGAVMPACVGVDIGCGMIAVRTRLTPDQVRSHVAAIREGIERRIPVGIGQRGQNSRIQATASLRVGELFDLSDKLFGSKLHMDQRSPDWKNQLGSLGGGNHFIEVCVGQPWLVTDGGHVGVNEGFSLDPKDEEVWIILHSGSRGVGNRTGTFWTKTAQKLPKHYMNGVDLPDPDLAALVEGTPEFDQYMRELHWCQEFARLNREEMMDRVVMELATTVLGFKPVLAHYELGNLANAGHLIEVERINCHHNYVRAEEHDGEQVYVTRKGAISAAVGERGLIPGSMGARSYIVTGLGNPEGFHSAPHGAGRRMSRGAARKAFTLEGVRAELEAQGIEARVREAIVDEAPGAYKDIDRVMADAATLVRPTHVLRQLVSVKGD
jgi:tRNA-splicing ligase RtcB